MNELICEIDISSPLKHTAVSCTENYYLMLFSLYRFDPRCLFFESYLDIFSVINKITNEKLPYLSFRGYKRIMDVGNELQIITYEKVDRSFESMISQAKDCLLCNTPIFIEIDANMLPNAGALPWTDSHYIMLYGIADSMFYVVDDYPRRDLILSYSTLKSMYKNTLYKLKRGKMLPPVEYYERVISKYYGISYSINTNAASINYHVWSHENAVFLRDSISFIRVSRLQMFHFMQYIKEQYAIKHEDLQLLLKCEYKALNRLYLLLEVYSKNRIHKDRVYSLYALIFDLDCKIIELLNDYIDLICNTRGEQ